MGLRLTGKGSILDAIGGAITGGANAVVSGARDLGDLGSLGAGAITGNQQAQQNAKAAIASNANPTSLGSNVAGLGGDIGSTALGAVQFIPQFAENYANTFHNIGNRLAGVPDQTIQQNMGGDPLLDKTLQLSGATGTNRQLASDVAQVGLATAAPEISKALEPVAAGVVGTVAPETATKIATGITHGLGDQAAPVASRVIDHLTGGLTAGAVNAGFSGASYLGSAPKPTVGGFGSAVAKGGAGGLLLGAAGEGVSEAADHITPLNEAGGINNLPNDNLEDRIHRANPLAPREAEPTPEPEPSASDLETATTAADQENAPTPIDYTQVEGAGKKLAQAVQGRASALQQADRAVNIKHTRASYLAEAERQLRNGRDEESRNYQTLARHADAERELKSYSQADRQSGYNKVKLRNAPAGTPKAIPSFIKEKINSPEYAAKRESGEFLQRIRDELPAARAQVQALDKQIKILAKKGDLAGVTALNEQNAAARLKLRYLEGQEKTQGAEYGRRLGVLDEKYPDAVLRQKGAPKGKVTISSAPVAGTDTLVKSALPPDLQQLQDKLPTGYKVGDTPDTLGSVFDSSGKELTTGQIQDLTQPKFLSDFEQASKTGDEETMKKIAAEHPDDARVHIGITAGTDLSPDEYRGFEAPKVTPYTGPNLNEGAFSPEDIKNLESHNGHYSDEEAGASYSPNFDMTLPKDSTEPAPRDLAGDTAAFNALHDGGSMEDAVKAYREATGASDEVARKAINVVAETGADMGTNEDVLRRNPQYGKVPSFDVKTAEDVSDKAKSYRNTSELLQSELTRASKGLSDHDVQLLDNLRGNTAETVAQEADNPEKFLQAAKAAKDISDYNHEIRRQYGDATIYRQNYGAGLHYSDVTPDEKAAVSGYRDTLASTPGFSRERIIGDYEKAAKDYGLTRKNANFLEDVAQDTRQTLSYVHDRSIFQGLQDAHGQEVVHYGNPDNDHPVQLNGTKDVFASREIAKQWNKLNPAAKDHNIFGKAYDATNNLIVRNIVFNPLFHGGNQLWQAGEAAGKLKGPIGITRLSQELATASRDRLLSGARGIYEHGGDIPDYGKGNDSIVSRVTHGGTDLAPKAMAAIEFRVRSSLYNILTDGGMDGREAVKTINTFMGDSKSFDIASHRLTIFLHYFKTLTNVQLQQVLHPVKYSGTIANKAAMLGALYGVNYAWQQFTGNKHASVRAPGGAGLIKEEVGTAENLVKGHYRQAASILTNRINPIPKEAAQQLFNQDLYTGQSLDKSGGRAQHAANSLVQPVQLGTNVTGGKKSPAELIANELQLNTPHAKGAPAAPSGKINILNTKGSVPATGSDPTGVDQETAYYNSLDKAQGSLRSNNDTRTLSQFNTYIARNHTPQGQTLQLSPADSMHQWGSLYANDKLRGTIQTFEKSQPNHNPIWDLSPAQLKTYTQYESVVNGEPQRTVLEQQNPWLTQTFSDEQKWIGQQTFSGNSVAAPGTPVYPSFSDDQNTMMNQVNQLSAVQNRTPAQQSQLQALEGNPDLQAAYHALDDYTNQERVAKGYTAINYPAELSQGDEQAYQQYLGLPTGTGAKSAWIKANPTTWGRIQSSLAANTLFDIENKGGLYELKGETAPSAYLKSVYNAGKYDIAPPTTPGGDYTLNPEGAYAASQSSGNSTLANELLANNRRREATSAVKYAGRSAKVRIKTNSQNKRKLGLYGRPRATKVAKAQTGKLRIKSVPVS